jgi:hypothetical protein
MSTVYVVQDTGHLNFVPAEKFGDLEVLIFGPRSHLALAREIPNLYSKLKNMTDQDWVLAVGHPFFIAAVGAIQSKLTHGVRMLYFDRQTESYIKVEAKV